MNSHFKIASQKISPQIIRESTIPSSFASSTLVAESSRVKLEQIRVPTFDGNPALWISFREMFCNLVHDDNSLTNV